MSKLLLGIIVGGLLGALDGLSVLLIPEAAPMFTFIFIGALVKGLLTGAVVGFAAPRLSALWQGLGVGLVVGLILSYLAALQSTNPQGEHSYVEIMVPGAIIGLIVGFVTMKYGHDAAASPA